MGNIKMSLKISPKISLIQKAFLAIADGVELQKQVEKFAFEVERQSKKVTPVDTGRLRSSIATDIGNLRATVAPHVNYGIYVHEGTKYMRARPFLTQGFEIANIKLYGGKAPFQAHIKRVVDKNLPVK